MKVLQVYNNYKSGGGGETKVVQTTEALLTSAGHQVHTLWRDNKGISSLPDKLSAFVTGIYSRSAKQEMAEYLSANPTDIVHVHNLYPLFSPSVLSACREARVPVVMTVHNHGLTCPIAAHFHNGTICEKCLGGHEMQCLQHNCKNDLLQSAGYALRSSAARRYGLFRDNVHVFIAISDSIRSQLVKGGYAPEKIAHIPHGVLIPQGVADPANSQLGIYVGGLNPEKGVETLLAAAAQIPGVPFQIAGTGPDEPRLRSVAPPNVQFLGWQHRDAITALYQSARFSVVPSVWWEPFGLVVIEAMSFGLPVIAARSGALEELVQDGVTGFLFEPGDADGLRRCVERLSSDSELCNRMGQAARANVVEHYGEDKYLSRLLAVYASLVPRIDSGRNLQPEPQTLSL